MGVFDLFQRKTEQHGLVQKNLHAMQGHLQEAFSTVHENVAQVSDALKNLHTDILQQKEWLKYLHQHHLSLRNQHTEHRELTKSDVTKLQSWITYLHKASQKQEKQLAFVQKALEESQKVHEKHFLELFHAMERLHKKASENQNMHIDLQALQTQIKRDLHDTLSQRVEELHETHAQKVEKLLEKAQTALVSRPEVLVKHSPVSETTLLPPVSSLANPEQKLLNLLMNEADPLSYTKISQMTGHSINTIRVTMNALKKKGLIEETTLPSGVKLFSVTSKEKVRKMYNLHVL